MPCCLLLTPEQASPGPDTAWGGWRWRGWLPALRQRAARAALPRAALRPLAVLLLLPRRPLPQRRAHPLRPLRPAGAQNRANRMTGCHLQNSWRPGRMRFSLCLLMLWTGHGSSLRLRQEAVRRMFTMAAEGTAIELITAQEWPAGLGARGGSARCRRRRCSRRPARPRFPGAPESAHPSAAQA